MANKFHILLVDDEQDFLDPISYWLDSKGYRTQCVYNGKDCLKVIEEETPDIVLLDINMPIMDGVETLTNIRKTTKTLPVVMITAESEQLQIFQELGISGFFPKGGTLAQLESLLEPVIRIHAKMKSTE